MVGIAGPAALGRSVVVGDEAGLPAPWADAERVVIDDTALVEPAGVVTALHRLWGGRQPAAIVLRVDPDRFRRPNDIAVEPWTLPAAFELWHDRLQFLVWANSYDARDAGDPPVWWWARKAVRLGAGEQPDPRQPGDVILTDGRAAWVDGGPRAPFPDLEVEGAVIVHREAVELGTLSVAPAYRPPVATLADDQLAAVDHRLGPARIIAPAGSGKTRVLTERLRHLVRDRQWSPEGVLAVAYNKRAQQELDARCIDFRPRTKTLNSLGLSIISAAHGRQPTVLDERDTRRLVDKLVPHRRRRANTDPIGPYLEALGRIRLGLTDPEIVESERDDVPGLSELFGPYRAELRAAGAVDFDEQVYGAIEALLADGSLRVRSQVGCRHLLVDEFQDLTPAHVLLLRILSSPGLDTFGVGDDDQVIYGHAGADPSFLIDYERLFPGAGDHHLEVNYRCVPAIVTAASHLLSYNDRRVAKTIRAARSDLAGRGWHVRLHPTSHGAAEVRDVVGGWIDAGVAPADIAVLCRVNSLLLAPHVALHEAGIPIDSVVGPQVLERTGLRAALAYLRIAIASDGDIATPDVVEILRRPSRGLPPWFSDRLRRRRAWSVHQLLDLCQTIGDKDAAKVERLVDDLIVLRAAGERQGATAVDLLKLIREDIGLAKAMTLLDSSRGGEGSSHLDDLEALEEVAELCPDPRQCEPWLRSRLELLHQPGGVTLSTVHRVKGMEWARVVVYGASAGILPHRLAEDVEEERRVLHVAITRAAEQIVVLANRGRPSPMLAELDGTAPHMKVSAARVSHPADAPTRQIQPNDRGELLADQQALEERLRAWRTDRARRDRVPPYIVLHDRTLRAIATTRPVSLTALRQVDGIGPTKLEAYGEEVLVVVAAQGKLSPGSESSPSGPGPVPTSSVEA